MESVVTIEIKRGGKMDDKQCSADLCYKGDYWHFHKCGRKAKFFLRGVNKDIFLCGIHVRRWQKSGARVLSIDEWTDRPTVQST